MRPGRCGGCGGGGGGGGGVLWSLWRLGMCYKMISSGIQWLKRLVTDQPTDRPTVSNTSLISRTSIASWEKWRRNRTISHRAFCAENRFQHPICGTNGADGLWVRRRLDWSEDLRGVCQGHLQPPKEASSTGNKRRFLVSLWLSLDVKAPVFVLPLILVAIFSCVSVCRSVRRSVHSSVRPLVRPSVRPPFTFFSTFSIVKSENLHYCLLFLQIAQFLHQNHISFFKLCEMRLNIMK